MNKFIKNRRNLNNLKFVFNRSVAPVALELGYPQEGCFTPTQRCPVVPTHFSLQVFSVNFDATRISLRLI